MLIHKYVCDRCGREIKTEYKDETIKLMIEFYPRNAHEAARKQELCEKCSDDFFKFINNKEN